MEHRTEAGRPRSVRLSDVDAARGLCAEFFYDVTLEPVGPVGEFVLAADVVRFGPITVGELRFGTDVRISAGDLHAYHVSLPMAGRVDSVHRGTLIVATPRRAAVYQPYGPTRAANWTPDCRALCLKFDRTAVEAEATELLGRPVDGPLRLGASLDADRGAGLTWKRLANLLRAEFDNPDGLLFDPMFAERYWRGLIGGLLLAVEHQYTAELAAPATPARPRAVRRAIELIEDDPARPLTTVDLARSADVGVRSLQEGFRRHVGLSPMAYLQRVRLERAHEELERPGPGRRSVAAIAHRWGFGHLGRFAAAYRARYGQPPSTTLRASYSPGSPCR